MTEKDLKNKTLILVIGVHKSATTSFYEYLCHQNKVFVPKIKELHFFTPLIYNPNNKTDIKKYLSFFKNTDKDFLLDVSPSYLYGKNVIINEIKKYFKKIKIVLLLRDPTERFVSFYKQGIKTGKINKKTSLLDYFFECREEHKNYLEKRQCKNNFINRGLREGCYSLYIKDWIEHFKENIQIIFFEDFIKNPNKIMNQFGKEYNLSFDNISLGVSNESRKPRSQKIGELKSKIFRKYESFFRSNKKLKILLKRIYELINTEPFEKNIFFYEKKEISKLYSSYNLELKKILKFSSKQIDKWK